MGAGKVLILTGLALVVVGVLWSLGARLGLGRLPGDIAVRGERWSFDFPIATCLLLSLLLTLVLRLIAWLRR